jgi:N-alpha-acetyltransferase 50
MRSDLLRVEYEGVSPSNLEELKLINGVLFPIKYGERVYRDILACGDVTQLARLGGEIIGGVACRLENAPGGPVLYIVTLGVLAPYRGGGLGSALLCRALSIVRSELPEVVAAALHVHVANEEAVRFYERHGFRQAEVVENYYRRLDPPHAVLLRLELGGVPDSEPKNTL